jgi:hypothetical protein
VTLREPSDAGTLTPGSVIRWEASDPDGDPLRYALFHGDGVDGPWTPIAIELEKPQLTVTDQILSSLAASESLYFRVVATDGVNSAAAVAPAAVRVEDRPPLVAILGAERPQEYPTGRDLVFVGSAIDREEGLVADERLVWRLDGDEVGRGPRLTLPAMPAGYHDLTLEATDAAGLSGRAALSFEVADAPQ